MDTRPSLKRQLAHLAGSQEFLTLVLLCVIIITVLLLVNQLVALSRQGLLIPEHRPSELLRRHPTRPNFIGPILPSQIQDWMTFEYLNTVFDLPPEYLKISLHITDPAYPRLSLRAFARRAHFSTAAVVESVRRSVSQLKNQPKTVPSKLSP